MRIALAAIFTAIVLGFVGWQMLGGNAHQGHHAVNDAKATEPGQGAFAALAEIVALLEADENTDWSVVDISKLREHLVDMNELTLNASVDTTLEGQRLIFNVSGEGRTRRAIQNVVPAHASVLRETLGIDVTGETTENGAQMILTAQSDADLTHYSAFGFFGIMATGAHHQEHHMAMARGQNLHQH